MTAEITGRMLQCYHSSILIVSISKGGAAKDAGLYSPSVICGKFVGTTADYDRYAAAVWLQNPALGLLIIKDL